MIKRVKELRPDVDIATPDFRDFIEKFESEINRGISTLCVLSIISEYGEKGTYGYEIMKELEDRTDEILIIEEGTLYPLLRKLERDSIVRSEKQKTGRKRKFYFLTENGKKILNYITGYYSKLTKAISNITDVDIQFKEGQIFCPMCANKIEIGEDTPRFCTVCGFNIQKELEERRLK
ncbi:MAG: hypothetical protein GF317_16405 [Candidatus Lokiarchaeota archaeon]|nr:hypothetical protein [Candidatus Lokiarchaeota archaeon]MBD3201117.1 hypothetical protein [Candidatus Lokiarchaeota archaeon]